MKLQFILVLILLGLTVACSTNANNEIPTENQMIIAQETVSIEKNTETADTSKPQETVTTTEEDPDDMYSVPEGTMVGTFEDATVYAGSIDFAFSINDKLKLIRIESEMYYKIEKGQKFKGYDLPKNLIDPSQDLEGPPGGNPKLIGKKFEITNSNGVLKIIPLNK